MKNKVPEKCICGAKQKDGDGGMNWMVYECLSFFYGDQIHNRTSQCYETEISQLKSRNEKLERVIEEEGDNLRSAAYHTYRRWKSGEDLTSDLMTDVLYESLEAWASAMIGLEAPDA